MASAAALALGGIASAGSGGLLPPAPESPNADAIRTVYIAVLCLAVVGFLLVEGALVVLAVRYRRGRRARTDDGPQAAGSGRPQLVVAIAASVVVVAIAGFVFAKLPGITDAPAAGAAGETRILVEGHQFYWRFRYPNGAVSINRLVAPADTVVRLEVTSPEGDVNHSWWAPRLGGKVDAIPGRTNETWFKASPGTYAVRCAELCGVQHALMDGVVDVVPRERVRPLPRPARRARRRSASRSSRASASRATGSTRSSSAPRSRATRRSPTATRLEALVRNGVRTMPAVGSTWTDAELDALYAYTKGLPSGSQG